METELNPQPLPPGGLLHEADVYLRENPVPVVLGAVALGFALGLLVRALETEPREERWKDRVDDTEEYLRSILKPLAKKSKKAYRKSSKAVRGAVDETIDRARDIDVEDYTDPLAKWFRGWWRKCCG